jgi:membrane protease YdiL (CAAX protease family)
LNNNQKQLWYFFLIAFGWMWGMNIPRALVSMEIITLPPIIDTVLGYLAVFGPGVAAFILTRINSGKQGVKALWQKGWSGLFDKKWLIPAFLLMPLLGLITLLILRLLNLPVLWEYGLPAAMIVPIGLLIWLLGALPEEYGWRGYALPRLMESNNSLVASLILGLVWGLWHLPLHFISTTTQYVIPVWEYVLQTIVLTIIYTWLYLGTGGSVLVAGIFHAMGNLTGAVIPYWVTEPGRWVSFVLLLIPALLIVFLKIPQEQLD